MVRLFLLLQVLAGDVVVDDFPWNDDVAIVNNESPGDEFSVEQPEQEVVQYGSGVVILQTSWVSFAVGIVRPLFD